MRRLSITIAAFTYTVVVVDALFVATNLDGTMNNVSPTFAIPDHLQYCVCQQIGPVCNVVDPGTWWSSSASAARDTACDDVPTLTPIKGRYSIYLHRRDGRLS